MSSIFPMTRTAIFFGSRARAASNSAEKICVAAPGIALGAHDARASRSQVRLAALDGSLELRRHFHLIFEPLLQPFSQRLCVFHRETRDCGFNFCDRAHVGDSSFDEIGLQGGRGCKPKRSAEPVPPEPPGLRGGVSPSPLPERGAPFHNEGRAAK